jgi:predicted metal-dependent peptidase
MPTNLNEIKQEARWRKAIDELENIYPLWYSIASGLELTLCRGWCDTAAVDGKRLFFNPEWTEKLSDKCLMFVLIHEVFHVAAGHIWRGERYIEGLEKEELRKTLKRINVAQDYAIHQIMVPLSKNEMVSTIEFPSIGLYDPKYDNMSFEQIYKYLIDHPEEEPKTENPFDVHIIVGSGSRIPSGATDLGDGVWVLVSDQDGNPKDLQGTTENPIPGLTKDQLQELKSEIATTVRDQMSGNLGSNGPKGSQKRVAEVTTSTLNWKQILARWVAKYARSDYSFSRPNRKYLHQGLMVPGLKSDTLVGVVAIDVSGSIDTKAYNSFITELEAIRKQIPDHDLEVIWCSSQIHQVQKVKSHQKINPEFDGTGGTAFSPVFDYVAQNNIKPAFLIYFTDGENFDNPKKPSYPVLWALNGSYIKEQPWGHNLRIPKGPLSTED